MDEKFDFKRFCDGVEGVLTVKEKLQNDPTCAQEWRNRLQMLKGNPVRLVVMGECKRGKSSFINALLGVENLVPVGTDIATSTVFRIRYGESVSYKVCFDEGSGKAPVVVSVEELQQYGTEEGNPNNEKGVAYVEATCPSRMLENQVEIVDTPGLGGLFKNHKAITYQYVPFADAVFLVTDSDGSPIGSPELDLLKDLKEVTGHIYFVQTKSRLVDEEARAARQRNNVRILADQAGFPEEELRYFVVDSRRKLDADKSGDEKALKRSGFDGVLSFMETTIVPNARKIAAERFMMVFAYECIRVRNILVEKKKFVGVTSEQELAEYAESIKKAEAELQEWQSKVLPMRRCALDKAVIWIGKYATERIGEFSVDGQYGKSLHERIFSTTQKKVLEEEANRALVEIRDKSARLSHLVQSDVMKFSKKAFEEFFNGVDVSAVVHVAHSGDLVPAGRAQGETDRYARPKYVNVLDRFTMAMAQGAFRGTITAGAIGGVGGALVGAAVGGLAMGPVGVFVGAVAGAKEFGTAAAVLAGGATGVVLMARTYVTLGDKDLEKGKQFYWQQITRDIVKCNKEISSACAAFIATFKADLHFAVDQGIKEYKAQLERLILDLKRKLVGRTKDNFAEKAKIASLEQSFIEASAALVT